MALKKLRKSKFTINRYFEAALEQARAAAYKDEVPIGAIIVTENRIIARAHNLCKTLADPTAHAEMQAITAACNYLRSPYLSGTALFVTLEPCLMCAAALKHAQLDQVFYLLTDNRMGYTLTDPNLISGEHYLASPLLQMQAKTVLQSFFKKLRV